MVTPINKNQVTTTTLADFYTPTGSNNGYIKSLNVNNTTATVDTVDVAYIVGGTTFYLARNIAIPPYTVVQLGFQTVKNGEKIQVKSTTASSCTVSASGVEEA